MLSCRKATSLIIRKSEERLSLSQHLQLFLHLRACEACRAFEKQSETIDKIVKRHQRTEPSLTTSEKNAIKEKIIN